MEVSHTTVLPLVTTSFTSVLAATLLRGWSTSSQNMDPVRAPLEARFLLARGMVTLVVISASPALLHIHKAANRNHDASA